MPRVMRRTPATERGMDYGYGSLLKDAVRGALAGRAAQSRRMLAGKMTEEDFREMALAGVGAGTKIARGLGKGKFPFSLKTTDIPLWDAVLKKPAYHKTEKGIERNIEFMSREEYFSKLHKGRGLGYDEAMEMRLVDKELVTKYAQQMREGAKFPMPGLEYKGGKFGQEGKHRMLAAEELGIDRIPVLIVKSGTRGGSPSLRTLEEVAFRKATSGDPIKAAEMKFKKLGLKYDSYSNPLPDSPQFASHQWTFYGEGPLNKASVYTKGTGMEEVSEMVADRLRKFSK